MGARRLADWIPETSIRLARTALPAEHGHDGRDPALFAGAKPVNFLEVERAFGDLQNGRPFYAGEVSLDRLLPGIRVIAGGLFGLDMLLLELAIRPPADAAAIEIDRFGKKLVAVERKLVDVDGARPYWPEAPAAFDEREAVASSFNPDLWSWRPTQFFDSARCKRAEGLRWVSPRIPYFGVYGIRGKFVAQPAPQLIHARGESPCPGSSSPSQI